MLNFWHLCHQTDQWSVWRQGACKTSRAANDRGHAYRVEHGQKSWQPFSPFFSLLINRLVQGVPAKVYKQGMQHKASQFTSVTHTVNT